MELQEGDYLDGLTTSHYMKIKIHRLFEKYHDVTLSTDNRKKPGASISFDKCGFYVDRNNRFLAYSKDYSNMFLKEKRLPVYFLQHFKELEKKLGVKTEREIIDNSESASNTCLDYQIKTLTK